MITSVGSAASCNQSAILSQWPCMADLATVQYNLWSSPGHSCCCLLPFQIPSLCPSRPSLFPRPENLPQTPQCTCSPCPFYAFLVHSPYLQLTPAPHRHLHWPFHDHLC